MHKSGCFSILILSGAVFFFGPGKADNVQAAGLFDAHDLIRQYVGNGKTCVLSDRYLYGVFTIQYSFRNYICVSTHLLGPECKHHCNSCWSNCIRRVHPMECLCESIILYLTMSPLLSTAHTAVPSEDYFTPTGPHPLNDSGGCCRTERHRYSTCHLSDHP